MKIIFSILLLIAWLLSMKTLSWYKNRIMNKYTIAELTKKRHRIALSYYCFGIITIVARILMIFAAWDIARDSNRIIQVLIIFWFCLFSEDFRTDVKSLFSYNKEIGNKLKEYSTTEE